MQWSLVFVVAFAAVGALAHQQQNEQPLSTGLRMIRKVYDQCENSDQIVKCLKEQAIKITERAIKLQSIPVVDGLVIVKSEESAEGARNLNKYDNISEDQIKKMSSEELDNVLAEKSARFLSTHQMSLTMSSFMDKSDGQSISRMIEEGRGKLKKYIGPILTAIAIKGGFVAMAFQAIALIAGKALLIGKIALVLSAIIGLKKLVSGGEAHEKTTYEIVKHPQVQQSHTYSSSHYGGGDFEASGGGSHYRRSLDSQYAAYSAYAPRN